MKDKSNDAAMRSKVAAALAEDKDTASASGAIHVQANGGVVILTGDVATQTTAEKAQMVVARLAGVRTFTVLAYGVLVPVYGLALCGLWGARHGWFPDRDGTRS